MADRARPGQGLGAAARGAWSGVCLSGPYLGRGAEAEALLRALPDWFGVELSILDYRREVDSLPTFVATVAGETVGALALRLHNPYSAEVAVVAVRPEWHGRGVGTALLAEAEAYLAARGVEYLQVKTLGPSRPDDGYERTRRFYEARGFRPLEELPTIWDADNPCLIMVKKLAAIAPSRPTSCQPGPTVAGAAAG